MRGCHNSYQSLIVREIPNITVPLYQEKINPLPPTIELASGITLPFKIKPLMVRKIPNNYNTVISRENYSITTYYRIALGNDVAPQSYFHGKKDQKHNITIEG